MLVFIHKEICLVNTLSSLSTNYNLVVEAYTLLYQCHNGEEHSEHQVDEVSNLLQHLWQANIAQTPN